MKKMLSVVLVFAAALTFFSCSQTSSENKKEAETYTITINSPQGVSVLKVSENGLINRSVYSANEMGIVTTRDYNYDNKAKLRSVNVYDTADNAYSITYGQINSNTERSAVSDQEYIPDNVSYITKTHVSGSRAASSTVTDVEKIEYYYDENGELLNIMRIDANGNVFGKDRD